jgi:predicted nucleic acid-binding protein
MSLASIETGEWVGVDTNILVYANQRKSDECVAFLRRCALRDVRGIVPMPIVAEMVHTLMLIEAKENGWLRKSNPARGLAARPDLVRKLVRSETEVREFLNLGLRLEPALPADVLEAVRVQRESGLLTNDALLLAVLRRLNVKSLATADAAFRDIPGWTVFSPDDIHG